MQVIVSMLCCNQDPLCVELHPPQLLPVHSGTPDQAGQHQHCNNRLLIHFSNQNTNHRLQQVPRHRSEQPHSVTHGPTPRALQCVVQCCSYSAYVTAATMHGGPARLQEASGVLRLLLEWLIRCCSMSTRTCM
jgi:hypothetical protein